MMQESQRDNATEDGLRLEISQALAAIEQRVTHTRGETEKVLTNGASQLSFNRELLQSMHRELETWEKSKPINLRISQLRGMSKLVQFLAKGGNEWNTGYFRQPTGAGKTVLYSIIARLLNRPTVVFVPRNNLLEQTKEEMIGIGIPEEAIGIVGGGMNEADESKQFLLVTYASHNSKMNKDAAYTQVLHNRELLVCDEAHKALGKRTRAQREAIGAVEEPDGTEELELTEEDAAAEEKFFEHLEDEGVGAKNKLTLAFTATTELRSKSVQHHFHELIAEERYSELIDAGILVPFQVVKAARSTVYEDELDYINEEDETTILEREKIYEKLLNAYLELRDTIDEPLYPAVFCANKEECDKYVALAKKKKIRCRIVTSREKQSDREALKKAERDLLTGKIDQIVGVDIFTEGWNLPPVNCAVIARASQSPARIVQGVGRSSRAFSGDIWKGMKLHRPLHKRRAYVLEAEWLRMMRAEEALEEGSKEVPGQKPQEPGSDDIVVSSGVTPLDLAQALALSGENPEGVVTRADGKELNYTMEIGDEHEGAPVCTLSEYAEKFGIGRAKFFKMVQPALRKSALRHIPNVKKKGSSGYVYKEADITSILGALEIPQDLPEAMPEELVKPKEEEQPTKRKKIALRANEKGEVIVPTEQGPVEAVTPLGVALILQEVQGPDAILFDMPKLLHAHGVQALVIRGVLSEKNAITNAYKKADVLELRDRLKNQRAEAATNPILPPLFTPDTEGKMTIEKEGSTETLWDAKAFAERCAIDPNTFEAAAIKLLQPLKMRVLRTVKHKDVYGAKQCFSEAQLQQLLSLCLSKEYTLELPDYRPGKEGTKRRAVALRHLSTYVSLSYTEFMNIVRKKNIKVIQISDLIPSESTVTEIRQNQPRVVRVTTSQQQTYYCGAYYKEVYGFAGSPTNSSSADRFAMYWLDDLQPIIDELGVDTQPTKPEDDDAVLEDFLKSQGRTFQ